MTLNRSHVHAIVRTAVVLLASATASAAQHADERAATPIEQALIEHACRVPGQAMARAEEYEPCLRAQLSALRTDFGPDLQKLTAAERRTIDKNCSDIRTLGGRDAYIGCLDEQLTAARNKRNGSGDAAATQAIPADATIASTSAMTLAAGAPVVAAASAPARSSMPYILVSFALVAAAGGGAWMFFARRPARLSLHICHICGADANEGDLCAVCRHDAAESQRRVAAERAEQQRKLTEAARNAQAQAEEQEQRRAEAERQARDAVREAEAERQREAATRREDETRRWQEAAAAAIAPLPDEASPDDPYAVLGLPATASAEEIRSAYAACRARYAPDQIAHLSQELQDSFRVKAAAAERAFQTLTSPTRQP